MGSMNEARESSALATSKLESELEDIATSIWAIARQHQGQSVEILAILRLLERLHQEIRDSFFQESLPDNRQALYALLRDIELSGGWPYIHRMKLRAFLARLLSELPETASSESLEPASETFAEGSQDSAGKMISEASPGISDLALPE